MKKGVWSIKRGLLSILVVEERVCAYLCGIITFKTV